jgi:hypothetical protein
MILAFADGLDPGLRIQFERFRDDQQPEAFDF